MEFGVGLFTGQKRSDRDQWGEIYDEMVALVEEVEELGFDSAWVSEHHFAADGYMSSVLPTLGAFTTATEDIDIGTAMLLAPLHDPVRVAEDAATVSLLSSGRLTLGLANGYCEREFDNFGVDTDERGHRTEEAIRIARGAWSDGPLGFEPRFHDVSEDISVTPKPDESPPIVLGGTSKPAVRRAAVYADGWNAPELITPTEVAKRVTYQRKLREVEKVDGQFSVFAQQYCFVADSKEAAWERIREPLFYITRVYEEMARGRPVTELSEDRKQLVKDQAMFGSPSEVSEQIESYRATVGDDVHMILRTYYPGMEIGEIRECNELLADEVIEEFR